MTRQKSITSGLARSQNIANRIFVIRGRRALLDQDLAVLYGVPTGNLVRAVKRNIKRFPDDFVFQLTSKEAMILKCQIGISSWGGRRRSLPYAFTEQGVAMLSSVLHSERAVEVNIEIMRAFVSLRREILTYSGLKRKIEAMEKKYDGQFRVVFDALKQLLAPPARPKRKIGFHT